MQKPLFLVFNEFCFMFEFWVVLKYLKEHVNTFSQQSIQSRSHLTSRHRQHHRLNTLSPLTSALGSEALYEAGVQVSRGQWFLFSENLLAGYVWLQANWRLSSQEVQHCRRGDNEPGRHRLHGGWQGLQGKHQERVSLCWELPRLLSHGQGSRWVKEQLLYLCIFFLLEVKALWALLMYNYLVPWDYICSKM